MTGKVLLGLLAGVAAGAVIGILFAPDRGSDTRKKIAQKSGDYATEFKNKLTSWYEKSMQQFGSVKDSVSHAVSGNKENAKSADDLKIT
jgi:gas vesicle protein